MLLVDITKYGMLEMTRLLIKEYRRIRLIFKQFQRCQSNDE